MGLVSIATSGVLNAVALLAYAALYVYVAPWHLPATAWYTWVIAIVGVDLLYYFYHRIAHRVRLIWATHQAHHSSQYFNFATALRQKWNISGDVFLRALLPLFGVPPWMVFASFSINLVYQFWIHTERIGKLWRPIEFVFNTPSHHRVHHGMDQQYLDKNYGGIFITVGPAVRQLQGRERPPELRTDQAGRHLQHLDAADPRVRVDLPRRSAGVTMAGQARLRLRSARLGAGAARRGRQTQPKSASRMVRPAAYRPP